MTTAAAITSAAPAAIVQLTAKEKRASREQARRQVVAEEKARIEQARSAAGTPGAAHPAAPAPSSASPEQAPAPKRSDSDREADAAAFLSGVVYPLVAFLAPWFGWTVDLAKVSAADCKADASAWVPLARRYSFVDALFTWGAAPARLVMRLRHAAQRKAPPGPQLGTSTPKAEAA